MILPKFLTRQPFTHPPIRKHDQKVHLRELNNFVFLAKRFTMHKRIQSVVILFSLLAIVLTGCLKEDFDNIKTDRWKPKVAVPLISSKFTAKDIIHRFETGGFLEIDDSQLITVVYTGELFSFKAAELFTLPDFPYLFPDTIIQTNIPVPGEEQLTSVKLNSGNMTYDISGSSPDNVVVDITILNAKKSNAVLQRSISIRPNGNQQFNAKGTIELDGYQFNLTGPAGTGFNQIDMRYRAYSEKTGKSVPLSNFSGNFSELKYQLVSGYLGEQNLGVQRDTILLDLFRNFRSGVVYIDDPLIELIIENSFGIPTTASLTHVLGFNENGSFPLTGSFFTDAIEVKYPDISLQGGITTTHATLNGSNSDLNNFIALTPGKVDFGFDMNINSNLSTPVLNYIRDSSKIEASLHLELPFQGRIDHVVLEDTFELSFSDVEEAESALFKLLVENSYPLDAGLQLYFIDSNNVAIDSLLPNQQVIFESGNVNEEGITASASTKETTFEINASRFDKIKKAKELIIHIELISSEDSQKTVKFLATNFLSVELGIIAQLNIQN